MVRIRKLVKNGAMTRNSTRFLYRPPRIAMVYATGNPIMNVKIVARPPYMMEFRNCGPNRDSAVTYASGDMVIVKPVPRATPSRWSR